MVVYEEMSGIAGWVGGQKSVVESLSQRCQTTSTFDTSGESDKSYQI